MCWIAVWAFAASCLDGPSSSDNGHRNKADKETPGDQIGPAMGLDDCLKTWGGPPSIEGKASGLGLDGFAQVVREHRQNMEAAHPPEVVAPWHAARPGCLRSMDAALEMGPEEGQSEEDFIFSLLFCMLLEHQGALRVAII